MSTLGAGVSQSVIRTLRAQDAQLAAKEVLADAVEKREREREREREKGWMEESWPQTIDIKKGVIRGDGRASSSSSSSPRGTATRTPALGSECVIDIERRRK
jgi:hypothetical protein